MMEVFQGVEFVALRVWQCDSYLHADEDGRSVYHRRLGGSGGGRVALQHNAVWAVDDLVVGEPPTRYVLLRGAYGRYLGTPDAHDRERGACCSLEATQRDRDQLEFHAIMWRAIGCPGPDVFASHGARGVVLLLERSGRYLRGNKSFLARRRSVSVDGNVDNETTLRWEVVPVGRLELPIMTDSDLASSCSLRREIRFVRAEDAAAADAGEEHWDSCQFNGMSVQLLREKLAGIVGYDEFTLCVRAGLHGRLTPLLINLPRSQETLHMVLVRPNTAVADKLLSPTLNDEMQPMNATAGGASVSDLALTAAETAPLDESKPVGSSTATGAAGSDHTADSTVPPLLPSSESDPAAGHERPDITNSNPSGGIEAASSPPPVDMNAAGASGERAKGKKRKYTQVDNDRRALWANLEEAEDDLFKREEQLATQLLILHRKAAEMAEDDAERVRRFMQSRLLRCNSYGRVAGGGGYAAYHAGKVVGALSGNEDLLSPLISPPMPRPDEALTPQIPRPENTVVAPTGPTAQNTSATATDKGDKDVWNKRQIGYVYILGTSLAVLFFLRPLLPAGYDRWMLAAFAAIWGLGSVGLPSGMFGEKFVKNFSRHMGHVLYAAFSVLVIYSIYLLALFPAPSPLTPPPSSPLPPAIHDNEFWFWRLVYGFIGSVVLLAHLSLWGRGCYTGADQDPDL